MSKLQNERLKKYIEAEEAILSGQSYTIGNRTLTRANLATVERVIQDLIAAGATVDNGESESGGSTKRIVLLD
nr:MAG TPA: head to tail adaptor [Caudoviricetes sp.]